MRPHPELRDFLRPAEGVPSDIFREPSVEARWLLRHASWLVSPDDEQGALPARLLRMVMVAPFTQLTFVSFDLQMFLFEVFHRTGWARAGHMLGMTGVNFFLLAGLAGVALPGAPAWASGATALTVVLLGWYALVAWSARLRGWWLVSAAAVLGLRLGAEVFHQHVAGPGLSSPWLWMMVSAFVIALSHAPESHLPPRAVRGLRWLTMREAIGEGPAWLLAGRALRIAMFVLWGPRDALWASPRLLPYNLLRVLFLLGYAPDRWAEIRSWSQRAVASGNPAIDYVGIGGGTLLRLPSREG